MNSQIHYLPLTPGLFSILVILFVGLIILIQLRILRYAYMRLGVGPGVALLLLFGSLIGSYFNIPITILPGRPVTSGEIVDFFGMRYVVPLVTPWPGTVLAVNVGGAVIPTLMSTYLVLRYHLWFKAATGRRHDRLRHSRDGDARCTASASPCRSSRPSWSPRSWPSSCRANTPRRSPISAARWER